MVAVTGAMPEFFGIKEAIFPVPLAANPIEELVFVQLYVIVPPVTGLEKLIAADEELLHKIWLVIVLTVTVGLTVIVNV